MQNHDHGNDTHQQHQDAGIDGDEFGDGAERQVQQYKAIGISAADDPACRDNHNAQQVAPPAIAADVRCREITRGGGSEEMQRAEQGQAVL